MVTGVNNSACPPNPMFSAKRLGEASKILSKLKMIMINAHSPCGI
jgi:hypothetical protein